METACVFKRIEKKYLLTERQFGALFASVGDMLLPDRFGRSTVMSLYLDTPDHRIIRESVEAVDYKQKLRRRSYGTASAGTTVFLELKKKFGGVVYKRRAAMTLADAGAYLERGVLPGKSQILSEIDWAMRFYGRPEPAMLIACEREALVCGERPDLRLTFDRDVRYRETDLRLDRGSAGIRLLPAGTVLMEIKTAGSMPLRLAHALDACGILPGSFSKYGTAYARSLGSRAGCGAKPANAIVSNKKGETRHAVNL